MAPSAHIPFETHGEDRHSGWLITCDHATNIVPDEIGGGSLGLPQADMERHIAYDVGAAGVSRALADLLDAPAILSRFSRLVIDPNRGLDDPTLLMRLYDGTIIPANRHADDADLNTRLERCYHPYHAALERLSARPGATLLSIHSFTPRLNGRSLRPWEVGILYSHQDARLAQALLHRLHEEPDLTIGENEPYSGHLPGDAVDRHALQHGRPNALIELRNDLIADEAGQNHWAARLAPILDETLKASDL